MDIKHVVPKAISDSTGTMQYIRVLGNTTGSHLLGAKENVYGPTDIVSVEVDDISEVLNKGNFDFVKMDVEGHELSVLKGFGSFIDKVTTSFTDTVINTFVKGFTDSFMGDKSPLMIGIKSLGESISSECLRTNSFSKKAFTAY